MHLYMLVMKISKRRGETVAIFNQCEHCGANLDPGERCDCKKAIDKRTYISLLEYERKVRNVNNEREIKVS